MYRAIGSDQSMDRGPAGSTNSCPGGMLDVLGNEPPELIGGQSLTEKEPLSLIASHGHKQGQLLLCLDALGDDCHTQADGGQYP